jgi:hypothetical protein
MKREGLFPQISPRPHSAVKEMPKRRPGALHCCCPPAVPTASEFAVGGIEMTSQLVKSIDQSGRRFNKQERKIPNHCNRCCSLTTLVSELPVAARRNNRTTSTAATRGGGGDDRDVVTKKRGRRMWTTPADVTSQASTMWIFHLSLFVVKLQQRYLQQQQYLQRQPQLRQTKMQRRHLERPGIQINVCACGLNEFENHRKVD